MIAMSVVTCGSVGEPRANQSTIRTTVAYRPCMVST